MTPQGWTIEGEQLVYRDQRVRGLVQHEAKGFRAVRLDERLNGDTASFDSLDAARLWAEGVHHEERGDR